MNLDRHRRFGIRRYISGLSGVFVGLEMLDAVVGSVYGVWLVFCSSYLEHGVIKHRLLEFDVGLLKEEGMEKIVVLIPIACAL